MMESQPTKSTTGGKDRISELPDAILHCIFRHIPSSKETVQTAVLSSRWRNLWRSYPVVEFKPKTTEGLQKFVHETMNNFSPDKQLRMESLKVSIDLCDLDIRSPYVDQLLDLASTNKAECVAIKVSIRGVKECVYPFLRLSFESLSNSSARTLHLERIRFKSKENSEEDVGLSLDSLLHLHLDRIQFRHPRLFTSLMASSPLLETLEIIRYVYGMRNLNFPNLKTLKISTIIDRDKSTDGLFMDEFIAPQLNTLEIDNCFYLRLSDVSRAVSKLENLKYLTLTRFDPPEKTLKLSCPKLEEFNLWAPPGLEEIELDVKPCFRKFFMHNRRSLPGELKKCEIHGAAADCRWEVDFCITSICLRNSVSHQWFVGFKSFMMRFPQLHAISISSWDICKDAKGEDDDGEPSLYIEHLKIMVHSRYCMDDTDFLNDLFWACHPRFLTVGYEPFYSKTVLEFFLNLALNYSNKPLTKERQIELERRYWLHQLKDVKIESQEGEQRIDIEEEIKAILKRMATSPEFKVCFELAWY